MVLVKLVSVLMKLVSVIVRLVSVLVRLVSVLMKLVLMLTTVFFSPLICVLKVQWGSCPQSLCHLCSNQIKEYNHTAGYGLF